MVDLVTALLSCGLTTIQNMVGVYVGLINMEIPKIGQAVYAGGLKNMEIQKKWSGTSPWDRRRA